MAYYSNSPPFQSFSAQSALNTTGQALDNVEARPQHSLFVTTGAGVSAGVVTLQGSNDGANWFNTSCTVTTNAANATFAAALANFPFQFVRAAITTGVTGGSVTAWVASA
jgi:hypothetical protein